MALFAPLVIDGITTSELIQYLLDTSDGPSILVVCGTKETFVEQLRTSSNTAGIKHESSSREAAHGGAEAIAQETEHIWKSPTLRRLAVSRTVKLAFCQDITHLRAYLATFQTPNHSLLEQGRKRILWILNGVQLHRPTSAYSAQGLNRTISAAVEAAYCAGCQLVMTECPTASRTPDAEDEFASYADQTHHDSPSHSSVWDEEVSMLNVTTKSFGVGERGWVGRTVKLRTIAERWCTFDDCRAQREVSTPSSIDAVPENT